MELLDFFISSAYAQDAAQPGGLMSFLPLIIIFVIFYFLLIRPQMKRAKEHKKLVAELVKAMKWSPMVACWARSRRWANRL